MGEVMYRMRQRMKDGKVPGFKHIADLYEDGTHLKSEGKYLETVTHYATVFQEDPHGVITSGLRFWKAPYSVDPKFAEIVWDVVWDVVTTYPQTGVKKAVPSIAEPKQKIAVGVYFNEGNRYCPEAEQAFLDLQQQTGRLAKVYMNFQSWTEEWNQFSTRLGDNSRKHGGVFMVVWMPAAGEDRPGHSDPNWSCKAIASGRHDAYINRYAADVKRWGKPVMLRLAHEMNGNWYPYGTAMDSPGHRHNGNAPQDYISMWRHVWRIFQEAGATNVHWVWSPNILFLNANNTLAQQQADYAALYPGDQYVDWIGLDGYCDGVKGQWKSFADLFDASYRTITAVSSKPLMIAELAVLKLERQGERVKPIGSPEPI